MRLFSFFLLLLSFVSAAGIPLELIQQVVEQGLTIDLKEVKYEPGIIFTEEGGMVFGPDLKIQGRQIYLTFPEDAPGAILVAQGDLFVEYGDYILVGDEFIYDFGRKWGILRNGTLNIEPWFFSACEIELLPNGEIHFQEPTITTSEEKDPAWSLVANEAILENHCYLKAFQLRFRVGKIPIFYLPWLKGNLDDLRDHPIKYRIRWGGEQGMRVGLIAKIFSWGNFDLSFRFDYRFNRGPGAALVSDYIDDRTIAHTITYLAKDNSIEIPNEQIRFRFQGLFDHTSVDRRTEYHLSYDKLSDNEVVTDYFERGLELKTGRKTEASIVRTDPLLISSVYTRVRVNNFEMVKQELPTLTLTPYPSILERSGWVIDGKTQIGFLDFSYPHEQPKVNDYHSARFFVDPKIYRTTILGPLFLTTTVGAVGIAYSDRPQEEFGWLGIGRAEVEGKVRLKGVQECFTHTIEPYVAFIGYTPPTLSPNQHFIFDIEDGWSSLQYTRLGVRNLLYLFGNTDHPVRSLTSDLYSFFFYGNPNGSRPIPKIQFDMLLDLTESIRHTLESGWDLHHQILDHFNYRIDWTWSENIAFAVEYRQRSQYAWRKLDYDNFFLDTGRSFEALLRSSVSDRRQTFLWRSFVRFHPAVALQFEVRHGWDRRRQPVYTEYEIDLLTTFHSIWELKISYQKKEDDHRIIALYFNLNQDRPSICCPD